MGIIPANYVDSGRIGPVSCICILSSGASNWPQMQILQALGKDLLKKAISDRHGIAQADEYPLPTMQPSEHWQSRHFYKTPTLSPRARWPETPRVNTTV